MWFYFWCFVLYSFFGFLLEVAFARLTRSEKQDRKCLLLLPLCPVYGLGALLILLLPDWVHRAPLLLFPAGAGAATAAEYAVDALCDRLLGVRFWDYSHLPLNINGRVCLPFSAVWGVLSVVLVWWVQPALVRLIGLIPLWLSITAGAALWLDALISLPLLCAAGDTAVLRWYDRLPRPWARRHS